MATATLTRNVCDPSADERLAYGSWLLAQAEDSPVGGPPPAPFAPVEVAYRLPGKTWRRRTFLRERSLELFLDRMADEAAEVVTRLAD